jgi:hypothetical protein
VLLLRRVNRTPISITLLAKRLKRDRNAVTRDVRVLERFGVIEVSDTPLPSSFSVLQFLDDATGELCGSVHSDLDQVLGPKA